MDLSLARLGFIVKANNKHMLKVYLLKEYLLWFLAHQQLVTMVINCWITEVILELANMPTNSSIYVNSTVLYVLFFICV